MTAYTLALLVSAISVLPAKALTANVSRGPVADVCTKASSDTASLWGIADTHAHQFANLGFGGELFWGKAFDESGRPERALPNCAVVHGENGTKDLIGGFLRGPLAPHRNEGFPTFPTWPAWNTMDHQQMYVDWLERAHRAGLRLMVMNAVNSEGICLLLRRRARGRTCGDMEAVDLQLAEAKRLEAYVDRQAGGPGKGWYRVVYSASDAREAIQRGQLAVVLGIEVDNLFNCRLNSRCTGDSVRTALDTYFKRGVRHLFVVHFADNAFGGYAMFGELFAYNSHKLTGRFPGSFECSSAGFDFHQQSLTLPQALLLQALGAGHQPSYPPGATCNRRGLTPLGDTLLIEMMKRGIIFELDHMSYLSARRAVEFAERYDYPLTGGHSGFLAVSMGQNRHEGQKTEAQLGAIRRSGGMISVILNQGASGDIRQWVNPISGDSVANNCASSTRTWAQAYLYAVTRMGGGDSAGIGIATDQSFYAWIGPRFGKQGCGDHAVQRDSQTKPIAYPFRLRDPFGKLDTTFGVHTFGKRQFNFNTEGYAEAGLLPDFLKDLENIGVTEEQLKPLYRSADAYVRMWAKAEQRARALSSP